MTRFRQLAAALTLIVFASACGVSLRSPRIADLRANPARYQRHSVDIEGVVTNSWGVPMAPFKFYRVNDGTGDVVVVSQRDRVPTRGAHVRVRGQVDELAVIAGEPVGVHLREERLRVDR